MLEDSVQSKQHLIPLKKDKLVIVGKIKLKKAQKLWLHSMQILNVDLYIPLVTDQLRELFERRLERFFKLGWEEGARENQCQETGELFLGHYNIAQESIYKTHRNINTLLFIVF